MHVLGYDMTQAANCAHVIYNMGQYVVKTYESDELNTADSILALLEDQNIPAELIET